VDEDSMEQLPRVLLGLQAGIGGKRGGEIGKWLNDDGKNGERICGDPDEKHRKRLLNGRVIQGKGLLFFLILIFGLATTAKLVEPSRRYPHLGVEEPSTRFRRSRIFWNAMEVVSINH